MSDTVSKQEASRREAMTTTPIDQLPPFWVKPEDHEDWRESHLPAERIKKKQHDDAIAAGKREWRECPIDEQRALAVWALHDPTPCEEMTIKQRRKFALDLVNSNSDLVDWDRVWYRLGSGAVADHE